MYAAAKATDIVQHFFFVIIIIIDRQTDRHHRFHSKPVDQPLRSEVGACSEDLVGQAAVVPDLVACEHLEVVLEQPGQLQERLLVRGLVRPLHAHIVLWSACCSENFQEQIASDDRAYRVDRV
jgi:hypothetical protein